MGQVYWPAILIHPFQQLVKVLLPSAKELDTRQQHFSFHNYFNVLIRKCTK